MKEVRSDNINLLLVWVIITSFIPVTHFFRPRCVMQHWKPRDKIWKRDKTVLKPWVWTKKKKTTHDIIYRCFRRLPLNFSHSRWIKKYHCIDYIWISILSSVCATWATLLVASIFTGTGTSESFCEHTCCMSWTKTGASRRVWRNQTLTAALTIRQVLRANLRWYWLAVCNTCSEWLTWVLEKRSPLTRRTFGVTSCRTTVAWLGVNNTSSVRGHPELLARMSESVDHSLSHILLRVYGVLALNCSWHHGPGVLKVALLEETCGTMWKEPSRVS